MYSIAYHINRINLMNDELLDSKNIVINTIITKANYFWSIYTINNNLRKILITNNSS